MTTTGVNPTSMPPSSERYIPADSSKRNSTTQDGDIQRKERSFQECLEFLMPIYLLPFVFGDKAGTCIYCVLLTVVGLMGRLLPATVAAMLPIVILPLGELSTPDKLAAEYMGEHLNTHRKETYEGAPLSVAARLDGTSYTKSAFRGIPSGLDSAFLRVTGVTERPKPNPGKPHVLAAFLLFAIAILGDETTVFFRLCLYTLQRFALRMQPLFLYLQFLVFALSLLLPSNLIVVFSTVFIDRFVTTVHNEIVGNADQRSSVRIQSSSTQNYFEEGRRSRWFRRSSLPAFARRARSVSVVSDITLASEASAGSSVIRQYRMHPPTPTLQAPDTRRGDGRVRSSTLLLVPSLCTLLLK
ncbi:hypothetical protein HPB49_002131 [Dermacentor silvarum]|uniref:Uncharacterized protein n=1 Tax=Dermacentor silvarum TaxID=543639 RepID=A0ACB8D2D7_DERSI|nr:hypothetical protein HPB49_002131 [Dermacentor silvarum]